jgi:hypothetical protein
MSFIYVFLRGVLGWWGLESKAYTREDGLCIISGLENDELNK